MRFTEQLVIFVVAGLIVFFVGIFSSPVIVALLRGFTQQSVVTAVPVPTKTPVFFGTNASDVASDFTISNFEYRFLRTSSSRIYDEYSYKVDINNRSDRAGMFFVIIKFYDAKGFAIEDGVEIQQIPAHTIKTVSSSTYVDYPQARDVESAKVEVQAQFQ